MWKLNRKGYLTIEIIIASVITFVIAFFLIDLTMKLVDTTDNAYVDTLLVTDKTLIINNIRKEIENDMRINGSIFEVKCEEDEKKCTIKLNNGTSRYLSVDKNVIKYSGDDEEIYSKKIHNSLSNIKISSSSDHGYYNFKITGDSVFLEEDYEMNINVYNESVPILMASSKWFMSKEYKRGKIDKIIFEDKVTDDFKTAEESWGAAEGGNANAITCYINETDEGIILTIAGNGSGKIYANPDSSFMFGDKQIEATENSFSSLTAIENLGILNTSLAENMKGTFSLCVKLENLNLESFDTSNVTNMYGMFYKCQSLETLDLSSFDTRNVTSMASLFEGCANLISIKLIPEGDSQPNLFDTSNVTTMLGMFNGCVELRELDLRNWNTGKVTSMSRMFSLCKKLESIVFDKKFVTSNVTNMESMFFECNALVTLNVGSFNTSKVTDMYAMFYNCSSLTKLDLSDWDTSNVTRMRSMFRGCKNLVELDVSSFNTSKVTSMFAMFFECENITKLKVDDFNTSNVTDMSYMFANCFKLTSISNENKLGNKLDRNIWDTSKVTSMYSMFRGCRSLITLDLSSFKTSNVTDMSYMFANCFKLTSISDENKLGNKQDRNIWDTSKVTSMYSMFRGCESLETLDLSSFKTSNVITMYGMFTDCRNITNLNISNFDTSNVIDMGNMFGGCKSLETLDLSSFAPNCLVYIDQLFLGCTSLETIFVSSCWDTVIGKIEIREDLFIKKGETCPVDNTKECPKDDYKRENYELDETNKSDI